MIAAAINIALWLFGLIFKPRSAVEDAKTAGAVEVQKSEAENAVRKITQADHIRDDVGRVPAVELQHDAGNLYRD